MDVPHDPHPLDGTFPFGLGRTARVSDDGRLLETRPTLPRYRSMPSLMAPSIQVYDELGM
jgi:hypothetical protein